MWVYRCVSFRFPSLNKRYTLSKPLQRISTEAPTYTKKQTEALVVCILQGLLYLPPFHVAVSTMCPLRFHHWVSCYGFVDEIRQVYWEGCPPAGGSGMQGAEWQFWLCVEAQFGPGRQKSQPQIWNLIPAGRFIGTGASLNSPLHRWNEMNEWHEME